MFPSKRGRSKLRIEWLERRAMLAGDVDVTLSLGTLTIAGDADDNDVSVTQDAGTGDYIVTGNGTTTLNDGGANPATFPAADVTNVEVKLKAGIDVLNFDANVPGFLDVSMGGGSDTVAIGAAGAFAVGGDLDVHTGLDSDIIDVKDLIVTGGANFDMSDGDDLLDIEGCTFDADLRIGLGHGVDTLNLLTVTIAGSLEARTGTGDDTASFDGVTVTGSTLIKTSDGFDTVTIIGSSFSDLEVRLGHEDDTLAIATTTVTGLAELRGSEGIDTFDDDTNSFGTLVTDKIENII